MDPYVYPQTTVLKNKLNITDEQQLVTIEAQLVIAGILDIESITSSIDVDDFISLKKIHYHLFHMLYEWAGEFRSINIYKSEKVLNGLSISYSDFLEIETDLLGIFKWSATANWNMANQYLLEDFSKLMTDIWRVHPFREGNTRTVSIFMKLFADVKGLAFNEQLLSQNAGYLRNALVMAAVEEAPEEEYLYKIVGDALSSAINKPVVNSEVNRSKYQSIGRYDVSNYEEKPFTTDVDLDNKKL